MKVSVVGSGYVGLVTGACLAEKGNTVTCIDIDEAKIERLFKGELPIYEPGLEELVSSNVKRKTLHFTTSYDDIAQATVIFLALPTPESEDGSADLKHVLSAIQKIGKLLDNKGYRVIVTKSTVPPGTAKIIHSELLKLADQRVFDIASNPEFLKEGDAIHDFQHPDRIVVGVGSEKAWGVLRELYLPFVPNRKDRLIRVGIPDAELIKYGSNVMLAARVALTNEFAGICSKVGADIRNVMQAIGLDIRIGNLFLNPGPGYGGSCFPKDTLALGAVADSLGVKVPIVKAIHASNEIQKTKLAAMVTTHFRSDVHGRKIAIWGLAFKPKTDDIRETPAIATIDSLTAKGATVVAYDPEAMDNMRRYYAKNQNVSFGQDPYETIKDVDALVVVTDWDEFKTPDWGKMEQLMKKPVLIDGRAMYEPGLVSKHGFTYYSIGRGATS